MIDKRRQHGFPGPVFLQVGGSTLGPDGQGSQIANQVRQALPVIEKDEVIGDQAGQFVLQDL